MKSSLIKNIPIPAFLVLSSLLTTTARAVSNDFGHSDSQFKTLSVGQLRDQFDLRGEIFVTDASGAHLLYSTGEVRTWHFPKDKGELVSNWNFSATTVQPTSLRQSWSIDKTGILSVHLEQFESMKSVGGTESREVVTGKKLRDETIALKDFAPINWIAEKDSTKQVILRLTPMLLEATKLVDTADLPVTVENAAIIDNKHHVWADGTLSFSGKYNAVRTSGGLVVFSFYPFKGGEPIGYAEGSLVVLQRADGLKVTVLSSAPIVSKTRVKVFGMLDTSLTSSGPNSTSTSTCDTEKSLERILNEFRVERH